MTHEAQALADRALLAALRRHVETDGNRLIVPTGERVDETEVEGLSVLMDEWLAKTDDPAAAVQAERQPIRASVDAFAQAARAGGLI